MQIMLLFWVQICHPQSNDDGYISAYGYSDNDSTRNDVGVE